MNRNEPPIKRGPLTEEEFERDIRKPWLLPSLPKAGPVSIPLRAPWWVRVWRRVVR